MPMILPTRRRRAISPPRRSIPSASLSIVEQNRVREWLQDLEHPVIGKYKAPGAPMRLSLTPMRVRRPAPLLDQHRKEILAELEK